MRQLNDFADLNRDNEIMRPIEKALSSDERQAVVLFYAGLTASKATEPKKPDDKSFALGAALALRGDWAKGTNTSGAGGL